MDSINYEDTIEDLIDIKETIECRIHNLERKSPKTELDMYLLDTLYDLIPLYRYCILKEVTRPKQSWKSKLLNLIKNATKKTNKEG